MWFFKKKKEEKQLYIPSVEPSQLGFSNDIAPLVFLIKDETRFIDLQFQNEKEINNIIAEHFVKSMIKKSSEKVASRISPCYKELLNNYFTDEGIEGFITRSLTEEMIKRGMSVNMAFFK